MAEMKRNLREDPLTVREINTRALVSRFFICAVVEPHIDIWGTLRPFAVLSRDPTILISPFKPSAWLDAMTLRVLVSKEHFFESSRLEILALMC